MLSKSSFRSRYGVPVVSGGTVPAVRLGTHVVSVMSARGGTVYRPGGVAI